MQERRRTVLRRILIVLLVGLCYATLCTFTSFRIPCVFYLVTNLQCPGCGVTRMCLALLRLDFVTAWQSNCILLVCAPFLGALFGSILLQYIKTGSTKLHFWQSTSLWMFTGILLLWCVVRNLIA